MTINATLEQQAIMDAVANGETIKVAALAGTGKTSTLVMIANAYPHRKGLYLSYNKAMAVQAQARFPKWIDCKTVHGLAYADYGKLFRQQLMTYANPVELMSDLGIEEFVFSLVIDDEPIIFSDVKMFSLTKDIVRRFMFSNREEINREDIARFTKNIIDKDDRFTTKDEEIDEDINLLLSEDYHRLNTTLFKYADDLWNKQSSVDNEDIPAEHDTYLKLYQLSKPVIEGYDYIMLDEAQDANPCIIDILINQKCQIIYVGDQYQQIYGYRGTINAMTKIEGSTYSLTQSFRFGKAIADEANIILEALNSDVFIKGLSSISSVTDEMVDVPYTFISRTNTRLLDECLTKIDEGLKCCFVGDLKGISSLIRSTFYLWCKRPEWVKDNRIDTFTDWNELTTFARESDDQELLFSVNLILKHGEKTLNRLNLVQQESKHGEEKADIVFITAHKAKGREWDNVVIGDDFNLKSDEEKNSRHS